MEPSTTLPSSAPDVAGVYEADWSGDGDCADLPDPPADFVTGPLEITGSAGTLLLDFTEASFGGAIDETFTFTVAGTATVEGWSVTVEGEGLAYVDGELWVLSGDLLMDAVDSASTACTASGELVATQIGAGSE